MLLRQTNSLFYVVDNALLRRRRIPRRVSSLHTHAPPSSHSSRLHRSCRRWRDIPARTSPRIPDRIQLRPLPCSSIDPPRASSSAPLLPIDVQRGHRCQCHTLSSLSLSSSFALLLLSLNLLLRIR